MHFAFAAQGTSGDIFPPLAVADQLHERGHAVSFLTNTHYGDLIRRHGLEFIDLDDDELFRKIHDPEYWDPVKGMDQNARFITQNMRKQYDLAVRHYRPGQTVFITSVHDFGIRIAQEKLGIPMVSAHICPYLIRSVDSPSHLPMLNYLPYLRWDPTGLSKRIYFWFADRFFFDHIFKDEINRFRHELGMAPVTRIFHGWMHSPELVIGLFPKWYVSPYPRDWPPQTRLTQFPLQYTTGTEELPEETRRFLDSGDPPIVFSPGTGMAHLRQFFETAVDACGRLRRRGLLLSRFRDQLPDGLPDFVHHEPYLPFSSLLPRAAALVSHGGIGSISQGLAAGIPQLLMPLNFDQPDNARRLREFGVARSLRLHKFTPANVATELQFLLQSTSVRENCQKLKKLFPEENPVKETCDLLEEFAGRVNCSK